MFVSGDIIYCPIFFNPRKLSNKNLTLRKNSKRSKILLPRRNKMGLVDTVIQEITDKDGMLEDIIIESSSTLKSVGSGDSGDNGNLSSQDQVSSYGWALCSCLFIS